jgi:hypothetical protein
MPTYAHAIDSKDVVNRLRRILSSVQLDCECRATLDVALDRFSSIEGRRQLRSALAEARRQREWIAAQLDFLADLDEITEQEADDSVYGEMAGIFDEIAAAAERAASVLRDTARSQ